MSILQDIMANAKAALVAAEIDGNTAFKSVFRAKIVGQSYTADKRPVAGVWRAINRPLRTRASAQTMEQVPYELILMVEIAGAVASTGGGSDASDDEMIALRDAVNTALLNNTLGNKCAALEPWGDDGSVDLVTPIGYEQVAFRTAYEETKPTVH